MSDLAGTAGVIANVDGEDSYVRIQVLTNAGALDRSKQLAVIVRLTKIAADAAGDPAAHRGPGRGLGLGGHANTNHMLAAASRTQVGLPRCPRSGAGNPLKDQ